MKYGWNVGGKSEWARWYFFYKFSRPQLHFGNESKQIVKMHSNLPFPLFALFGVFVLES